MPIYEYQCNKCNAAFDCVVMSISEKYEAKCEKCGSTDVKKLVSQVKYMAGPEENSWKSILTARGYEIEAVLEGLGSNDLFADIFVDHINDAAHGAGITLK